MRSDINVTPLVDVVLVLLIIFMVVTPMMQRGREVDLPRASHTTERPAGDPLVVSMDAARALYIESVAYPDAGQLQAKLAQELRAQPNRRLLLKADQTLSCGDFQRVLQLAHASGARGLALGVEQAQDR